MSFLYYKTLEVNVILENLACHSSEVHVARICTRYLEAENVPVLPWPAYSPAMSPIEHVWDAMDRRVRQRIPVSAIIQQLRSAIEEEWDKFPQVTINSL
jgi:transposase